MLQNQNPLGYRAVFSSYWRQNDLTSKIIALNIFSFILFGIIENTLFRYLFEMTFEDSMRARLIAAIFNTLVGISWPKIEVFFQNKFSNHPWKFIRNKWEEFSLLTVKIAVNFCTYIFSGHHQFNLKLGMKVGIIVIISFVSADWLKYTLTPKIHSLLTRSEKKDSIPVKEESEEIIEHEFEEIAT